MVTPEALEDIFKTGSTTPHGCYEFFKMPFGIMKADATFVRCMRRLITGLDGVGYNNTDKLYCHVA